mmetsp:Transcript_49793/g.132064  ORF Transcript_49793/g.132064 Transcript_49793/m.132064 type:complete len:290 (-) Transcript_49793:1856-2725(-)
MQLVLVLEDICDSVRDLLLSHVLSEVVDTGSLQELHTSHGQLSLFALLLHIAVRFSPLVLQENRGHSFHAGLSVVLSQCLRRSIGLVLRVRVGQLRQLFNDSLQQRLLAGDVLGIRQHGHQAPDLVCIELRQIDLLEAIHDCGSHVFTWHLQQLKEQPLSIVGIHVSRHILAALVAVLLHGEPSDQGNDGNEHLVHETIRETDELRRRHVLQTSFGPVDFVRNVQLGFLPEHLVLPRAGVQVLEHARHVLKRLDDCRHDACTFGDILPRVFVKDETETFQGRRQQHRIP